MPYCVAFGCKSNSKFETHLGYFSFPREESIRKLWIRGARRKNWEPTIHSKLCSAHFTSDCYSRDPQFLASLGYNEKHKRQLRPGAVPTIFDYGENDVQEQEQKPQAPKVGSQTLAKSKEKRKKKSRKRKSKQSHKQSRKRKKKASDQKTTELEDVQQEATDVTINNGGVESFNPGVVFMNIKEEVIDPEYERVLLYSEMDTEDGPLSFPEADEEDEFVPQTDDDEETESVVQSGLRFSDMGDGVPLIMEIKQEVEDQGYAVINQWDEATMSDLQKDETSPCPFDIKTENIDDENQSTDNSYNEDTLNVSMYSHLQKFLLHKFNFWVFHCPLCSSQQVFLHRSWLQQHLEEPFHKEKGKISPESQELLQDLLLSEEEQFCPVVTCQIAVEGGVEEFCKHLLSEHIDTLIYIRKLCQINVFCQETGTGSKTKYSLTVQLNGKWHTFYRTKESSEIQTLIKEDSVEFFPVAKIVDTPKMKMTVRVNKNPVIMKPRSTVMSHQVAPRDTSSFCFDDITYYKCPICPSLTVFFDVLCLKTHMIKKSHQLSSVCRVLKEIGVQHPTHTCPVLNCNEDFGKSQKKQLKHIMTEHPEKYDILKRLMDGCYQNFQSIAGIEGCIGGLQGLGIPQPQTINVTYRAGSKLPTLKPKPPPSTSPYQNPIVLSQPQQPSTLIGSHQPTSGPAVFTSMQSPVVVAKSKLQMFPSSQTVRQILDSKLVSKKRALDSGDGCPPSGEVNTSSNGITTLASSDSHDFQNVGDQQTLLMVHSATGLKPRPICYKCGVNALSNIGLISHLFSDHCNLICKICSFTAEPLKINNNILNHMKDFHNIDSSELELNIWQSVPDIYHAIGVSQLDGLSCITQRKFILDELVVHYALVDASSSSKFQDNLIVKQVKKEGDEVWIEILVGEKRSEDSARLIVNSSLEVNLEQGKYEDIASAGENNRNLETGLSEMMKNKDIATSSESLQSDAQSDTMPTLLKPDPDHTTDNCAVASNHSTSMKPIGRQADIERVSPSSGYNSPIRRWLIQESIKEIRLEKLPFANSLHCLRCQVTASTNRGFLLHIFACHSVDVCKLCFYDLSKTNLKEVKGHLSTHPEYDRKQPVEDYMTLSCPEFMQLLGIPSLDQLCNITRDRIIFTFRVVWYRMAQICFESESKNIMQRNLTVNSSPKAGTPDIILFFKNKDHRVIHIDNEGDSEVTKETSFRPEDYQFPCIATEQISKTIEVVAPAASEVKVDEKCSSSSNDTDLETTRQFVEGKDFTIVLQGNDRVFKCLKCTRAYWNKCKMRRHLKVHLNIRNYQCHLCQKCFHYNYHLKAHMNIHNNSRPYKCNKCSKSYNNSGSLSWHVRQCHGLRNFSKNKVAKIQCQVCYIQVRQELYHEHLRERHGVSVAYQYVKSENKVPEGENTAVETEKIEDGQDTEDDTSQDEFPWRGELIVDEGDADDEPDSYDLAPATAQNVFSVDGQEKDTGSQESYDRQEVFQCTFCNMVYSNLPEFSMHTCPGRHNQTNTKLTVSKKSLQNYTETYTCSNCKRTSLLLETFTDSSHPCALNSVSNFTCEKTYTCKLCQLIFTNLLGVQKHACENADKQIEESEEEPEPEAETQQVEAVTDLSADLTCPVCNGIFSMTDMPYHLSSKHHLNRKVVLELMQQNNMIIKK